jgi:S1-C subfamily serine protease
MSSYGLTRRSAIAALSAAPCWVEAHSLARLAGAHRASVVPIGTFSPLQSPRFGFRGTGFAVADGSIIATCFHVLPDTKTEPTSRELVAQVRGPNGEPVWRSCKLLASDRNRDLCVLRLEGQALPALPLSRDHEVDAAEGSAVAFIGFPIGGLLGFSPVIHHGIISSHVSSTAPPPAAGQLSERSIASVRAGAFEILQLDAIAYPGNSGGPLFNAESGNVVGVISMVLVKGTRESAISSPTGISYAVPTQYLTSLLRSI